MHIFAAVVPHAGRPEGSRLGKVWGIGIDAEIARYDARRRQLLAGDRNPASPTDEYEMYEVTIDQCVRICDGDVGWPQGLVAP